MQRQLVEVLRQKLLVDECAAPPVDEDDRRLHGRQVEHLPAIVRVGLDAAIGDDDGLAIGHQQRLVGVHAMGVELADAGIAGLNVIDRDETPGRIVVVLGGVHQPPVRREEAVAEIVPAFRRGQRLDGFAGGRVEDDGEGARAPGEDDGTTGDLVEGDVVAAIGQGYRRDDLATICEDGAAEAAVGPQAGGAEERLGPIEGRRAARRQAGGEGGTSTDQEAAAVDEGAARDVGSGKEAHRPLPFWWIAFASPNERRR